VLTGPVERAAEIAALLVEAVENGGVLAGARFDVEGFRGLGEVRGVASSVTDADLESLDR